MQKRNLSRPRTRGVAATKDAHINWQQLLLVLLCGAVTAAGFFFAARQHFMTIDYGFKNSRLKKQLEELEAEKRRLTLAREVSLSPVEIRKASRTVALGGDFVKTVGAVKTVTKVEPKAAEGKSLVVATASVKPVRAVSTERPRADRSDGSTKVSAADNAKREVEIAAVAKLR